MGRTFLRRWGISVGLAALLVGAPAAMAEAPKAAPAGTTLSCAEALKITGPDYQCAENDAVVAIAADRDYATAIMLAITDARKDFGTLFGMTPPRSTVFFYRDEKAPPAVATLEALPGDHFALNYDALFAVYQKARPNVTREAYARDKLQTARHELSHSWFNNNIWPRPRAKHTADAAPSYGSAGPDWLDEVGAMVAEGTGERYRAWFLQKYRSPYRKLQTLMTDVEGLLAAEHPAIKMFKAAKPDTKNGGMIMIQSAPISEADPPSDYGFYERSWMFSQYLRDRGRADTLTALAKGFGSGLTMAQWLTQHGAAHGLPRTVAALEKDYGQWIKVRFGPPGPRAID